MGFSIYRSNADSGFWQMSDIIWILDAKGLEIPVLSTVYI
jgi:hypothetical protein